MSSSSSARRPFSRNQHYSFFCRPEARRALRLFRILRSLLAGLEKPAAPRIALRHSAAAPLIVITCDDAELSLRREVTVPRHLFRTLPHGRKLQKMYRRLEEKITAR